METGVISSGAGGVGGVAKGGSGRAMPIKETPAWKASVQASAIIAHITHWNNGGRPAAKLPKEEGSVAISM
jgi:hypothetical protein